ncbi:DEAD/DEAH box helicase [Inquilinus sp. Marseille-Q2685]|uniref:DEAD/DEAH box helicase n=1 Tax=Inquilinus sp. Marseille-Q2685 TaxID=2866581 RepID=UPI001CE401DF|nr:DEAD/DEAH box helicase [Inquilinus sp. Marseille-Q2685]
MLFSDLGLKPEILRAVDDVGYTTPPPIQAQAIPYVLMGRDVLGIAQTGPGKTAGFPLPMIEILASGRARARMPRSLILEPTRELAAQVAENFELYGKYEKLSYALLIGGESFEDQIKKLDRGVDVLIATPGRMLDLFERGKVLLADVKILVIDEADRMLDMGFIPDIERIVGLLPPLRQTLFFSATMPPEIRRLSDAFLSNPKQISVAPPATTADTVEQSVVIVEAEDKRKALRHLLRQEDVKSAFVFCNRKRDVSVVFKSLQKHGFNVGQLHGDMVQSMRNETLDRFRRGEIATLVCSDVAARGIDVSDIGHVFNFDVPIHADDYVHRVGRTGRAGKTGKAYSIATPEEGRFVKAIETLIKKQIPLLVLPEIGVEGFLSEDEIKQRGKARRRGERPEAAKRGERSEPARRRDRDSAPESRREERAEAAPRPVEDRPRSDETRRGGDRPRREDRERDRRRHREDHDDVPVLGLGDHVPAFLLRPVPQRKRSAAEVTETAA